MFTPFTSTCLCHARCALQVLCQPVYMEDHVGVLEEEVNAGLVPVPALPKFKQVSFTTALLATTVLVLPPIHIQR